MPGWPLSFQTDIRNGTGNRSRLRLPKDCHVTQAELLRYVAEVFEDLRIRYMIGGSQASVYYGESRFTQDIDLVADIRLEHVPSILERFPTQRRRTRRTEHGQTEA